MFNKDKAKEMLTSWKKNNYSFGIGVLEKIGEFVQKVGNSTMLVITGWGTEKWIEPFAQEIKTILERKNIKIKNIIRGASPNAPREDVYRIANQISKKKPRSIVAIGGGSTIDAVKAAIVLSTLDSDDIETYFGMGFVTDKLKFEKKKLPVVIAVQTASSSGAHLTKYSNITDSLTGQKKLIIDDAIIPPMAVFDYSLTIGTPYTIKTDGALDGIAHCIEVACGALGKPFLKEAIDIAEVGISLIVHNLPQSIKDPENFDAVECLGLGTDLGGYAIMVGGTNFGHLFSFSLVSKLTHGRACAIADPYTLVFFAPAIEPQLKLFGSIFRDEGYIEEDLEKYKGRELGIIVCNGMLRFLKTVKFPITFGEEGIDIIDKERILEAAKNPQLWSKLEQAPVSLIARDPSGEVDVRQTEYNIDEYMGALVDSIVSGDINKIKNIS